MVRKSYMKGRLIKMKKSTKIIGGIVTIAAIAGVVLMTTSFHTPPKKIAKTDETIEEESKEISVSINTEEQDVKKYEPIVDVETGEEVIAEVQENVPPEPKPEPPKEAPKASGDYKNPNSPPTYTKEQTHVETTANNESAKQTQTPKNGTKQPNGNKVYVEGFGYVEDSGPAQGKVVHSDGDINKMVGTMD